MAFFKFRKGGDEPASPSSQPESVDAMRRRAKHRLIGAVLLVLAGVVGFPLLFDTRPRPVAVDIPIEIPDRNKARPLGSPVQNAAPAPTVSGPVTVPADIEPKAAEAPVPPAQDAIKSEAKPEPKPEPKSEPKPEPKAAVKPETKAAADTAAGPGRFVVQVGAFADAGKARETRLKVEKSGLKTYTHVAETKDGKRIRVRVGPFATRADADRAADKIKGMDLPASILTL